MLTYQYGITKINRLPVSYKKVREQTNQQSTKQNRLCDIRTQNRLNFV